MGKLTEMLNKEYKPKTRREFPKIEISFNEFYESLKIIGEKIIKSKKPNAKFKFTDDQEQIIRQLYFFITKNEKFNGDLTKGIIIAGSFGNGKTFLMRIFSEFINFLNEKHLSFFKIDFKTALEIQQLLIEQDYDKFDRLSYNFLIIDDIGKEEEKIKVFGTEMYPLRQLLNARYETEVTTFGTTNYKIETLEQKYGGYIGSRLHEMFNFFVFKGKDMRKM